ncbi:hypothetical protein [Bradyrhizobium sp. 2S1]|uniref:hypothetical protein n=1 Tax=Bradyrhizobium sp. 2S1 TaxID=1404429 RepID=UPI001408A4BB|nr:hypothetical protein [Bradyrhizobium sp. 2S1]MCK7664594.1 hypothetical protein [Bradyrhizobium sp. 2S1]
MLYRPSSCRKTAIALTTGAVIAAAAAFPAAAQQASSVQGSPACASISDNLAAIKCEIRESERRTQEAKARGIAADARAAAARADSAAARAETADFEKKDAKIDASTACFEFIKKGVTAKLFEKSDVLASVGGRITIDNACIAANKFGYDRRASNAAPVVR